MNNKFIKTECGLEKYNQLNKNKTFLGKVRLFFYVIIASIRDLTKWMLYYIREIGINIYKNNINLLFDLFF